MKERQLSVEKILRHKRHDFLNELQLILMNIDLGNNDKAKETILKVTDRMKQYAALSILQLPKTAVWLETFDWIYPSFSKALSCEVTTAIHSIQDEQLVAKLNELIDNVIEHLEKMSSYEVKIDVISNEKTWHIGFIIKGKLPHIEKQTEEAERYFIEQQLQENLWKITINGK